MTVTIVVANIYSTTTINPNALVAIVIKRNILKLSQNYNNLHISIEVDKSFNYKTVICLCSFTVNTLELCFSLLNIAKGHFDSLI